jgi:hypothetical protein
VSFFDSSSVPSLTGAKIGACLATGLPRWSFRVDKLRKSGQAEVEAAVKLADSAVEVCRRTDAKHRNHGYYWLIRRRARMLSKLGNPEQARAELTTLRDDLARTGVSKSD